MKINLKGLFKSFISEKQNKIFQSVGNYIIFWPMAVAGRVLRSRIFLSILPSGDFLGIGSVFSEAQHGVRAMWCCAWQSLIFWKKILHQKWGKWAKNGPKIEFFEFIEKLSHWFFLNLVFKESLYYLPYSCTNPILEIWAKMCLASQIAGFLNWHL